MTEAYTQTYDQARMLMEKRGLFDITSESGKLADRYGKHDFGRHCLLSRRLLEGGATFVKVSHTNYDTHHENFDFHIEQLGEFDRTFATLLEDLDIRGLLDSTLVVVMSEFGRTLDPAAGAGSDHAWGNHWFAVGGPVKGGVVYGNTFPTLQTGGPDDASLYDPKRGQWIPQFSSDQFMSDIVRWLGLTPAQTLAVLPNLANFSAKTIGYL